MMPAPASSPTREGQYHLALARFTTGFGMGPGGTTPLWGTGINMVARDHATVRWNEIVR